MNMKLVNLIMIFAFFSCSDVEKEKSKAPDLLLPGKTGSWWQYKISTFNDSGNVKKVETRTMSFAETIEHEGHIGYKVNNIVPIGFSYSILISISTYYLQINSDLYLGIKNESEHSVPPRGPQFEKYFNYPTYIGDTILVEGAIMKTESLNSRVTVPLGSFDCIKYSYVLENDTLGCIWFKPKIGIIRIDEFWSDDKIRSELVQLNLAL